MHATKQRLWVLASKFSCPNPQKCLLYTVRRDLSGHSSIDCALHNWP